MPCQCHCAADSSPVCQNSRVRESSVAIDPNWKMLEEIDFLRLAKLRLDVDEPETVYVPPPFLDDRYVFIH